MNNLGVFMCCCTVTFVIITILVSILSGGDELNLMLKSSANLLKELLVMGVPYVMHSFPEFLGSLCDTVARFAGELLEKTFIKLVSLLCDKAPHLVFFLLACLYMKGWYTDSKYMIDNHRNFVISVGHNLGPAREGIVALWGVVSNPGKLVGYAVFIAIIRGYPDISAGIAKAMGKGMKL